MTLAFSRPFLPLFLHLLGAMTLFGAVLAALVIAGVAWGRPDAAFLRRAGLTSLLVAVPAWVVTAVGAYWIESKEGLGSSNATWLGLGHLVLEGGLLVLLAAIGCAYWWARSGKPVAGRAVAVLGGVYLVLLTVAMLAMSGKWS